MSATPRTSSADPVAALVVAAFDMAAAVEVFTVENICDVGLGVARSGRGGVTDQAVTSATPRPLRLSIHVDKRGWRVIARRPDTRARFCRTGFDTKKGALGWCQELGQQEQRPVSVHVTDAEEDHEYHWFPYPAAPKPPVDAKAHPSR